MDKAFREYNPVICQQGPTPSTVSLLPENHCEEKKHSANEFKFDVNMQNVPDQLSDLQSIVKIVRTMLDAPSDLPSTEDSFQGLAIAMSSLEEKVSGANLIGHRIEQAKSSSKTVASYGATVLSLSRRKNRSLLYHFAIELGKANHSHIEIERVAIRIFGVWCLIRLFEDYQPAGSTISKVLAACISPTSAKARQWSVESRARTFTKAIRYLELRIHENQGVASGFGLCTVKSQVVRSEDPIEIFNRRFRRRTENLLDYASKNAVAGANGYGALSRGGLLEVGQELRAQVLTGSCEAALVCLELITHLSCDLLLLLPVKLKREVPKGALGWLDLFEGTYSYKLYRMIEKGARRKTKSDNCYETTTQTVTIPISSFLTDFLCCRVVDKGMEFVQLSDLLGESSHHPRSAVVGKGAYRATARRAQESLPPLLLDSGHHRWPVALATNSLFLVSKGRSAYGCCRSDDIFETITTVNRLLGWPVANRQLASELVGSFTTPKAETISSALNHLAIKAGERIQLNDPHSCLVSYLNSHAQWLSMLMALSLALRDWRIYKICSHELSKGVSVHFDDKDVHEHKGSPVPVPRILHHAHLNWRDFCHRTCRGLRALNSIKSETLANLIEKRLNEPTSMSSVFTIDIANRLEDAGSRTWVKALPETLSLRPSFARQFWPMHLMNRGLKQLDIDQLMRHQIVELHPGSSYCLQIRSSTSKRLSAAINDVIDRLQLIVPSELSGD